MMMEIYFDEEKCKEYNYDINERYQIIEIIDKISLR